MPPRVYRRCGPVPNLRGADVIARHAPSQGVNSSGLESGLFQLRESMRSKYLFTGLSQVRVLLGEPLLAGVGNFSRQVVNARRPRAIGASPPLLTTCGHSACSRFATGRVGSPRQNRGVGIDPKANGLSNSIVLSVGG